MPGSLFRRESEQARSTRWLGKVVLIRPVSFTFMTAWALGFAVLLAIFFVFGEYTRKARVAGVLAPREGVAKIVAQQAGIVEAVHVKEGAHVRKDEPMIVLGDGRAARGSIGLGAAVISHLDDRKRSLMEQRGFAIAAGNAEQASFAERRTGLVHEAGQLEGEIATQRMRLGLAGQGVDRANRLEDIGFLSTAALDRERDAALDQQSRLEQLQRARSTLLRDIASLEFEAAGARSRGQAQVSAIDMQRASLEQERVERESQFHAAIVAPTAGTVATVLVEPGQMVVAGTPLVALVPSNSTLEALLYAPSRSIGFVHEGEDVLLRYLAYPHQKFGVHRATIVAVSRNPMLPGELGFTPLDGTREPLYRIKATLDSQAIHAYDRLERLQPGMQFEADIILDRRRLIEWIFEPLLGLAGRT
jgi:membrane fusion protein